MKKILFGVIAFLIFTCQVAAQDSLTIESLLSFDLNGQHNLAAFVNDFECINCSRGRVEDNPFFHFAIYLGITNELIINENFTLETGIFLEERSHSGGNNTLSNIVFFPKILLQAKDTVNLFSQKIGVKFKGGDFWDEDVHDITRLYNLDYQCLQIEFALDNWSVSFMTIGDLSLNVGLDLTQVNRASLGFQNTRFSNSLHLSQNALSTSQFTSHTVATDWNVSNYSRYNFSDDSFLESQFSLRLNRDLNASFAAVLKGTTKANLLLYTYGLRYYQGAFNQGYNGRKPRYSTRGQYVGEQLYPLKNYYRPFSQWAAYTHESNQDVLGLEVGVKWEKQLFRKFYFFNDIDLNGLYNLSEKTFRVFPFYNIGLNCKFLQQFHARISVTNKQMDLYNFYQTVSASKVPFLSLGVRLQLNEIRLVTKHYEGIMPSS